jgi:membrane peptidoglycan carboxypeptidase
MVGARRITRVATALCVALVVVFAAVCAYYFHTVFVARRDTAALVAAALRTYGDELAPSDLSPKRLAWLIKIEDPAFFLHHGVDLSTPGAGMTTITQGLVKLLYFPSGFHAGVAKIRQTLIAEYALDARVSKEDQLRLMLNMAYLGDVNGRSVHGFAQAAQVYFGKDFGQLSDEQYLTLVAMLIGPNAFKPGSVALAQRMELIQEYLAGTRTPASLLDVEYKGVQRGSTAEELLMWLLRRLTPASPQA